MTEKCPLCEQPASATARIKMGQSWTDTFGRPPASLFSEYVMIHVTPSKGLGQEKKAYLHNQRDLQQ